MKKLACLQNHMIDAFNPAKIKLPIESTDSALTPHSRGIIFAQDVTASMGLHITDLIPSQFFRLIYETFKIASWNSHIMFMGIGDVAAGDHAPLQVTGFESDLTLLSKLSQIWFEGKGGGNYYESYILAWYFAANYTRMDCYDKRSEKGFLFTFGDEAPTPYISKSELETVFGNRTDIVLSKQSKLYFNDCFKMASKKFYCYHIVLNGYGFNKNIIKLWKQKMGAHCCYLSNHIYLTELITTILKMYEGVSKANCLSNISDPLARLVVEKALSDHEEIVRV